MTDIYSIGEMVIDFTPGTEPASYIRNAGGAPANVAIAAAKNGLSAALCCSVGDDDFGSFLMATLSEHGVRTLRTEPCRRAITTMVFVSLNAEGERSFTFARRPGADMFLKEADVKEEDIAQSVIIHAGSCSLSAEPAASATRRALRLGKKFGRLTSFDLNYRQPLWDQGEASCISAVMAVLDAVDMLKISEEEADLLGGREGLYSLIKEKGLALVVLTRGSRGAEAYFAGQVMEVTGKKAPVRDTTAAGDAFWGGFLSSLRKQKVNSRHQLSPEIIGQALEYANTAGTLCVGRKGAIAALPSEEEIRAYMGGNV